MTRRLLTLGCLFALGAGMSGCSTQPDVPHRVTDRELGIPAPPGAPVTWQHANFMFQTPWVIASSVFSGVRSTDRAVVQLYVDVRVTPSGPPDHQRARVTDPNPNDGYQAGMVWWVGSSAQASASRIGICDLLPASRGDCILPSVAAGTIVYWVAASCRAIPDTVVSACSFPREWADRSSVATFHAS